MSIIRTFARGIPFALFLYRAMKSRRPAAALKLQSTEDVLTKIYQTNFWNGKESPSGPGLDLDQANIAAPKTSNILKRHNIKSILDVPSEGSNWQQKTDLLGISYIETERDGMSPDKFLGLQPIFQIRNSYLARNSIRHEKVLISPAMNQRCHRKGAQK